MARWGLHEWAVKVVEGMVDEEAEVIASKGGGFHLKDKDATWTFVFNFSMRDVLSMINVRAPTALRVMSATAIPCRICKPPDAPHNAAATFCGTYYSKQPDAPEGRDNRRDPMLVSSSSVHSGSDVAQ